MEIKNEEHAREMLIEWQKKPQAIQRREIRIAIEKLELSAMYYEQKGNIKAMERSEHCNAIISEYFATIK